MLTSKDAKKVYAGIVAAGLRAKETVLETAEKYKHPHLMYWQKLKKSTKHATKKSLKKTNN